MSIVTRYQGAPGWIGTTTIDNFEYPTSNFHWQDTRTGITVYSASSMPFCDTQLGAKTMRLTVSGVCRLNWNPFRRANPPYTGTYVNINFQVVPNGLPNPWIAIANYAYVEQWTITDDANGVGTWAAQICGNWVYTNWGGQNNN